MRTLGILGGMSWESTAEYYRLINRGIAERLGGLHSARLMMHSVDFAEVAEMQRSGNWRAAGATLGEAAAGLERIGAEAIVLATNTMHQVAADIERAVEKGRRIVYTPWFWWPIMMIIRHLPWFVFRRLKI